MSRRSTRSAQGDEVDLMPVAEYVRQADFRAGYADGAAGRPMADPGDAWEYEHGHQLAHAVRCRGHDPLRLPLRLQVAWFDSLLGDGSILA